jgi:hypothetical protein
LRCESQQQDGNCEVKLHFEKSVTEYTGLHYFPPFFSFFWYMPEQQENTLLPFKNEVSKK